MKLKKLYTYKKKKIISIVETVNKCILNANATSCVITHLKLFLLVFDNCLTVSVTIATDSIIYFL